MDAWPPPILVSVSIYSNTTALIWLIYALLQYTFKPMFQLKVLESHEHRYIVE